MNEDDTYRNTNWTSPLYEQRRIVAYLDGLLAKVNTLRELQSARGRNCPR